jgi:hypothetical protein
MKRERCDPLPYVWLCNWESSAWAGGPWRIGRTAHRTSLCPGPICQCVAFKWDEEEREPEGFAANAKDVQISHHLHGLGAIRVLFHTLEEYVDPSILTVGAFVSFSFRIVC